MSSDDTSGELPTTSTPLTRRTLSAQDATTAVHHLVRAAQQVIPTAGGAGLSLLDEDGTGSTVASTGTAVEVADALQHQFGMGPSRSAWITGQVQRIDDSAADPRWGPWQAGAATAGIRSVLSVPLPCLDRRLGALTVYATAPDAFGDAEERLLGLLADAAATVLGTAQDPDTPVHRGTPGKDAPDPGGLIGLAAGVLMDRDRLSPETARAALLEAAGTEGRGLAEIATAVVDAATGHEQAGGLQATMTAAFINRQDLWLHHFSLGGSVKEFEIDAYVHHALLLPQLQRDLLAHAASEILDQAAPPRAHSASVALAGLICSTATGGQGRGTLPASG